tara:strand:- start:860 stop:1363 length:504 start_codon:yes stop_codon:yes gene_type:complete
MFAFYNKHNNNLYIKLVEFSRNIFFYQKQGLKDSFETRVNLIFIHFSIILIILKNRNAEKKMIQNIFDNIFTNIEYHMREMGVGDVGVNKKMKILNKVFYNILLKINSKDNANFTVNKNIIKEHLYYNFDTNNVLLSEISDYFESFYKYCFVLDDNSMLKGKINFKF